MDLNYYLHREQVELIRADSAESPVVRNAHLELAELYRQQIEDYQAGRLASFRPLPVAQASHQPVQG